MGETVRQSQIADTVRKVVNKPTRPPATLRSGRKSIVIAEPPQNPKPIFVAMAEDLLPNVQEVTSDVRKRVREFVAGEHGRD